MRREQKFKKRKLQVREALRKSTVACFSHISSCSSSDLFLPLTHSTHCFCTFSNHKHRLKTMKIPYSPHWPIAIGGTSAYDIYGYIVFLGFLGQIAYLVHLMRGYIQVVINSTP